MELDEKYSFLREKIRVYTECFGIIKPKDNISRFFDDHGKVRDYASSLLENLLAKGLSERDRQFMQSIKDQNDRGYLSLKQLDVILKVYGYYESHNAKKSALASMDATKKAMMAKNIGEGLTKTFQSSYNQKQKNPFRKTRYEKYKEMEKRKKDREKENKAVQGFGIELDSYLRSKKMSEEVRRMMDDLLPKLDEKQRKIIEMNYGLNGRIEHSVHEISKLMKCSIQNVSWIRKKALKNLEKILRKDEDYKGYFKR